MNPNIPLSKSAFIRGLQCYKSLYLKKHHPDLEDAISDSQQAIFDNGTNIGMMAQKLFPNGVDLGLYIPDDFAKVFSETDDLIKRNTVNIYEAGFKHDNQLCFIDILEKKDEKYYAYEVKGSTSVKDVYLWDTAFQYYVITSSGIELEDISVVYINTNYVRQGDLNVQELFTIESVKNKILLLQPKVEEQIKQMRAMLNSSEPPQTDIGPHCNNPYNCSFMGHCWKNVPDYSVFNISRLSADKKFDLYHKGILEIADVPDSYPLSANQQLQVYTEKSGERIIDKKNISTFVESLNYPLYFLDFETFNPAIPKFDQSKPFQQITFQYSLHIQQEPDGVLIHKEFLAEAKGDPRVPFIEQLIKDLDKKGDIIVYSSFEKSRLNDIAKYFPAYEDAIRNIISRIVDLMLVFSQKHYYTPEMKGSYSIKVVLPALAPQLSYKNLNINNGGNASMAFATLYDETDKTKIEQTRKDLLEYCKLDTLAMVEILNVLKNLRENVSI